MRALVTGGAGFIGSNLVEALVARGASVRVLDNLDTGHRENLADLTSAELVVGDVRDGATVRQACRNVDVVFHLAALGSVPGSLADPVKNHEVNVSGTFQVLEGARAEGVRRIVFASSSAVYGDGPTPQHEELPLEPKSPYAASKAQAELMLATWARCFGVAAACLRFFNVYGPRQDPASQYAAVIPVFAAKLLRGESPVIYGDGEQTRGFTHVDDVVRAVLAAAETPALTPAPINVSTAVGTTVNEVVAALADALGATDVPVRHAPERDGDIRHSLADVRRAKERLGFEARIPFVEGVRRTAAWYRRTLGDPRG